MKETIEIEGMSCQHCVATVKKALESIAGIRSVEVDLQRGRATFERDEAVSTEEIKRAIVEAGYKVSA